MSHGLYIPTDRGTMDVAIGQTKYALYFSLKHKVGDTLEEFPAPLNRIIKGHTVEATAPLQKESLCSSGLHLVETVISDNAVNLSNLLFTYGDFTLQTVVERKVGDNDFDEMNIHNVVVSRANDWGMDESSGVEYIRKKFSFIAFDIKFNITMVISLVRDGLIFSPCSIRVEDSISTWEPA